MPSLLGIEYAQDPLSRLAPPEAFDVIDAGDLDDDQSVLLRFCTRKIRCNTAGVLNVLKRDGGTALLTFAAGETKVVVVAKLLDTSTTVTGSIEIYY